MKKRTSIKYCMLLSALGMISAEAQQTVNWTNFRPLTNTNVNSPASTLLVPNTGGSFTFQSTSEAVSDSSPVQFDRYVAGIGRHGAFESNLSYVNGLNAVGFGHVLSFEERTDTLTFNNFSGFNSGDTGLLYIEGLMSSANDPNGPDPSPMSFSVSGGSATVASWTQRGTFAPRLNNDLAPVFSAASGTLTAQDSGVGGVGDTSGIFIDLGLIQGYDTLTIEFDTPFRDGYIVGLGIIPEPVPEPSSVLLLGFGGLSLLLRRRRR